MTRNNPFFSVVVPNLDEEKYLPTFLNSLLNQTFMDFELIIVDGCSTDNSLGIIKDYMVKLNHCVKRIPVYLHFDPKRNIGYIRNVGSKLSHGYVLFHTSSDTYLEPLLLEKLYNIYEDRPYTFSVSGRTYPFGSSIISHVGYQAFDLLRFLFTLSPFPVKKYRPSGNFFTIKKRVFDLLGGYPEVPINEDGLLGYRIDEYLKRNNFASKSVFFNLKIYVGHYVKRFEKVGSLKTFLFYFYVLGNLFPFLHPFLKHIEVRSGETFRTRSDLQ